MEQIWFGIVIFGTFFIFLIQNKLVSNTPGTRVGRGSPNQTLAIEKVVCSMYTLGCLKKQKISQMNSPNPLALSVWTHQKTKGGSSTLKPFRTH